MIEEKAQVIEINGNKLVLHAQRQSACGSCSANNGCGTSLLAKVVGRKFSRFQADNSVNAHVGDTVVVAIPEDAMLKGSMVMYLVPILGMIFIALLADFLLASMTPYRDLVIALAAVTGLISGSILAKRYFASQAAANLFAPVVLRKIID